MFCGCFVGVLCVYWVSILIVCCMYWVVIVAVLGLFVVDGVDVVCVCDVGL